MLVFLLVFSKTSAISTFIKVDNFIRSYDITVRHFDVESSLRISENIQYASMATPKSRCRKL